MEKLGVTLGRPLAYLTPPVMLPALSLGANLDLSHGSPVGIDLICLRSSDAQPPPFLFFYTQLASRGVLEKRQEIFYPFWPL